MGSDKKKKCVSAFSPVTGVQKELSTKHYCKLFTSQNSSSSLSQKHIYMLYGLPRPKSTVIHISYFLTSLLLAKKIDLDWWAFQFSSKIQPKNQS